MKRVFERLEKEGLKVYIGFELEFYIFKKNGIWEFYIFDSGGYFDLVGLDKVREIRREIVFYMLYFGLKFEVLYYEVGKV